MEIIPNLSRKITSVCRPFTITFPEVETVKDSDPPRDKKTQKTKKNSPIRWTVTIIIVSFCLSVTFNAISEVSLKNVSIVPAFFILGAFIFIGIAFDVFGMATATASEKPFHAMSSKKLPAAKQAIALIRNSEKVSNFCNDVVGDICGIMSGSTAAVIAAGLPISSPSLLFITTLGITGIVASITIGGKALGKGFATKHNSDIVLFMANVVSIFKKR